MRTYRKAIYVISLVFALGLPITASAATFEVKALIDTDTNRGTGCSVLTAGGVVSGIDIMLTTAGNVSGATHTVTGVTRQTCVNPALNLFSTPVAVDGGWSVGVSSIGDLLIESHLGAGVITMDNVRTPRFVFTTTSDVFSDALLTPFSWGGGDIVLTHAARDRAVATRPLRIITLDGDGIDWDGVPLLANGSASSPGWRFISATAYVGINDLFFKYQIHTNPAAPTAHDDNYALATLGGSLTVSTLGVLNNDIPNNQPITATLVDNPQHGTVSLNPNGGFTYTNDGALAPQDQFHYVDSGPTLQSNIATVTIDMPGSHPYTFTSADHVTFVTGQSSVFQVTVTGKPTPALSEDGTLPAGIGFVDHGDGTGTLSGTPAPNTGGVYAIVFSAEKNKPHQTSQNFTLTIVCPAVTVTNPSTSTGSAGAPFSQTFTQSGGFGAILWSKSGTLPTGLSFNTTTGVLSGTPTQPGTFPIVVTATDSNGCAGTGPAYNLIITCPSVTVTNPATSSGTANTAFSQTFTQSGGVGAVTFSLNSGTLPAGLTLSGTGVLSGTPTQTGSFPITVKVTDSNGCIGVGATYTLVINCQVITVTNPATNTGTANTALSKTFTASNTIGTTIFTVNSGTLPAGLTLSSAGVLSGTPTQTGSFSITVKATDANGCFGVGGTYTLTIACQVITVNNPATNTGTANVPFSQTFTASNAIAPVTFSLNSGTLPTGITLSSAGVLSGTPTQTGSFPITVKATDANGCTGTGGTYTLTIGCQVITVNNPATNTGTVNVAFSQTFTASNAIGATTFTTASTLPTGITLSPGGVLSGTPTQSGSFPMVVHVVDANGCAGNGATYTLTINCQVITVNNPATNTGTVNVAFSQTFTASNTIGGTTFTTASTLPTGITLSTGGVLSGTPTQSGSFPIVVHVVDANGCAGNGATYSLVIGCQVISVTNPGTNTGTVNTVFGQTFTAGNTIGTVTFSTASTLPAGLVLSTGGILSGTPTQTGSFPIVVTATDANGCSGSGATYTLTIGCQVITVNNPATTTGTVNTAFSQTFTAGNTVGALTFTTASTLPTGLALSTAGVLSGTPTQTGSFPIVVHVVDGNGCSGNGATYTLVIGCQTITVTNPATNTGTVSAPFTVTFTSSNTIGTVTYTTASTLPAGITLSSAGVLAGTPTQSGSFPIVVTATDSNGCFGNGATYTLVIGCQVITVTNPATTSSPAGAPLSINFTQSGAIGTATFTTSSTLPTGLTLATNGTLSGTPTQGGAFPIVVTVTDSNGCTGTNPAYTLTLTCPTITVTNPVTTTGTVNVAFSQTFTQSGGVGTTTFSIFSGTLPAGLTLHSATGVLDGTPTQTGSFPLVIRATDSNGCTGDGSTYTLVIGCQVITVNNPGTTTGTVNTAFSQTFTASNTIAPVTFTLNSGSLPAGMTLNSSTGVISGTPTQTGSFPITVKATDANGCFGIGATYTLVIGCQIITVTNPATTTGTVNTAFSQTFTAGNTIGTVTFTTASTLPTGLSLSTAGVLSGTPTQKGSFPIVVHVVDGNGCSGNGATYTLVIGCQTITVTNPATTTGTVSAPFTQTFTQSGGFGTTTFSTVSTLPAGLTLAVDGTLSGTPTQAGTFPIVVTATDSNTCTGSGATYTLIIACQTITVTNPVTNSGAAGAPFSQTFTQTGGIGTTTFSETGALPTGLTFHTATGVLDGTPSGSGSFPITVTATDSNGCTGTGPTYTLTITCPTITVTNPGVSTGTAGVAFSQTFTQTGGQGTITWSETGALPAGITINSVSGVLSGTTNAVGSFPITVTATDGNGCTGTGATYTLTINCQTVTVTNPGVNTGTVDAAFSQTFTKSGILGTVTWSETGALPAGITLNSATGVLSGTPTVPGSFPITVKATDTNGCFGTSSYTLTINCQTITVTKPVVTTGTVDTPFSQTFTQSGAGTHTPVTFTVNSGSLPSGLTLSTAGVLSGTPLVPGSFPITVKATDVNGCFGVSTTYTLVIACQTITVTNPATTTGTVGVAFSQTFTQSGVGTHTPATFTTASTLPTGFSLSTAGVLSGTTNQHGTFPIVVTVTDANGCTGTGATYNLVINCQTITVTNPGVNTGTVGTPFSQTFTQSGSIGGSTFTTASTLPVGLSLSTAGVLSGTPTQSGTFPIVVTVTDGNGCTGAGSTYTLIIACNVISVTNPGTTTGTAGVAFSATFTQTGGNGTIVWSETGALPAGITMHSATGILSGTTSTTGSFPITVTATDANGCTGTGATYTLVINCQTVTVNNPATNTGTAGVAFSQTFTATGILGSATWSEVGALPAGITLSAAGVLFGTTSQTGSFPITVKALDTNGCFGTSSYTLTIVCQTVTVTNPIATAATFNVAFSATFTASGILGTATFTVASGTLPTGMSLSTAGVLSGTPTQTGTFPITVKATDTNLCNGTGATYTLSVAPVASGDSYGNLVDNTQAVVTGGGTSSPGTPFVTLTGAIIGNDTPAGGVSANPGTFATSAGGSVTIASDGTFIYTPKANPGAAATTLDTFTYTVSSNTGGVAAVNSAAATVTLNLAGRVWYVKNNGGGSNGQSQSPFTTLAAAAGASTANDIIFVYNGDGTNSGQNAGITLKSGQQLLGEINGLTVNALSLVAVGSRPTIGNATASSNGIDVPASAGSVTGVFIKGLSIAGTANGINLSSSGANTLTATVDNVNITAATANNGIKVAAAGTLTSTVTIQNSVVNAAGQNGIDAQQTSAGNLVLNINNNNITATGTGININGSGSTLTTITNFASNTITGNTGGSGIVVNTATFDGTPGGAFTPVSGGTTAIGPSGNPVGGSGMVLTSVKGDLSFADLDISNSSGSGLSATGVGTFNSGAGTGFQIAITANAGTISAAGGPAVNLNTVTGNLQLSTISSSSSATTGVALNSFSGTFSAPSGSTITGSPATAFQVGSSVSGSSISYAGTINTTVGKGVDLTSNTGSTISFTGALTLSSALNTGFNATGGGTVTSTATTSTITATSGTALNVANTTIGGGGLKFQSVSAGTGAGTAGVGISLDTTGAGSLTVSGTGSAGSGGTIQHKTGADGSTTAGIGIYLNSTTNPSFSWMQLNDFDNFAIRGTSVSGLTMDHVVTSGSNGNNGGVDEGTVAFGWTTAVDANPGLTGSVSITNCNFGGGSIEDTFRVRNGSGSLNRITMTNDTFACLNTTGDALKFETGGSGGAGIINATITNSFFTSAAGDLFNFLVNGTSADDLVFTGNTLSNNNPAIATGGGGVTISGNGTSGGNLTFNISNNSFRDSNGHAILIVKSTGPATFSGTFGTNTVGVAAIANSGSVAGSGIKVQNAGQGTVAIAITGNQIRQYNNFGIELEQGGGATAQSGTLNANVTGNTVSNPGTGGLPMNGIQLNNGTVPLDTYFACVNIGGAGALANSITGSGANAGTDVRVRQRQSTTVNLPGYGGATTDVAAVQTYLSGRNGGGSALASANAPPGGGFTGTGTGCP